VKVLPHFPSHPGYCETMHFLFCCGFKLGSSLAVERAFFNGYGFLYRVGIMSNFDIFQITVTKQLCTFSV
jgi:hypothetical protein